MRELRRFEPPHPPGALRASVLARAREAAASSPAPSRADRIFYSRGWRLAWAAAIAALALVEAVSLRGARWTTSPAIVRESDAAAEALGLAPGVYVGERVVTGDDSTRALTENAL